MKKTPDGDRNKVLLLALLEVAADEGRSPAAMRAVSELAAAPPEAVDRFLDGLAAEGGKDRPSRTP